MLPIYFAAEAAEEHATGGILGFSVSAFVIQLITFIFVFLLLKRFAFKPIVNLLEKRRQTIEDGVRLGEKMEKRQTQLEAEADKVIREARHDADRIIANAHKESREVIREAEKAAKSKADAMLKEADARIDEDAERARRSLEKDLVGLVSEATEAVVHEKVDAKKDAEIALKALKGRRK
jgi:F-type H+-transporting ATPase subunit b